MKKWISLLLSVTLIVTLLPCSALAATRDTKGKANSNPEYLSSVSEAGEVLREAMTDRKETVTIYYQISKKKTFNQKLISTLTHDIYEEAVKHTGNPKEGDYLDYTIGGYKVSAAATGAGDYYNTTLVFYVDHYNDAAQEKKLDKEIVKLKKKLGIDKKSDAEKVKAIHDYMKANISYDYDGRNNSSNKICHTAYAALIKGKAVCQGYSTLFYRLALEYGIDTRIVSGQSLGENHGWNIVKVDGKYYNIDVTWDSTTKTNKYFLKGSAAFPDHQRDAEHSSAAFDQAYPMSETSYAIKCSKHEGVTTVAAAATLTKDGKVVTTCKNCNAEMKTEKIHKASKISISFKESIYDGKAKSPKIVVKDSAGKTISASHYKLTKPAGRKNVGTYTYKITFNDKQYSGSKKLTLTINPKAATVSSVTAAKKAFTVKWKKASAQTDGYQVQYATNKNFTSGKKTVKVKGIKSVSAKITGLKAKQKYHVRVRTYKVVSGKTYYSDWSKEKTVTTKK